MTVAPERLKFTVDDYFKLAETGFLNADSHIELIKAELVIVSPKSMLHNNFVNRLNSALMEQLRGRYVIAIENTIRLSDTSAPEPDLAVLDLRTDDDDVRYATASDVYLVVEVSCSTLEFDRTTKLPMYAAAGVPEVWIVNAAEMRIEQYTQPAGEEYTRLSIHRGKATVTSPHLPLEIVVRDIIRR